jgi:microcystin-dependent protein
MEERRLEPEAKWLITKFLMGFILGAWVIVAGITIFFTNGVRESAKAVAQKTASEGISGFFQQGQSVQQAALKMANDAALAQAQAKSSANQAEDAASKANAAATEIEKRLRGIGQFTTESSRPPPEQPSQQPTNAVAPAMIQPTLPLGSIVPFAGTVEGVVADDLDERGWLPCQGQEFEINDPRTSRLFKVIRNSWGGVDGKTFRLPDLRGRFLRGIDGGSGRDADAAFRTNDFGKAVGAAVGSVQSDEIKRHTHASPVQPPHNRATTSTWPDAGTVALPPGALAIWGSQAAFINEGVQNNAYTGGNETRPKNAYIVYLIKFR